jgi:tetratricopeptide (TPR) repeat protein
MRVLGTLILSLAVALPIVAQHDPAPAAPPTTTPDLGLGTLHWPVSTRNHEAQEFFDQGMKYLYAFNHEMAIKSFRRATELDPDLAMGYWGIALALGPNINFDVDPDHEKQAYDAEQQALAHEAHAMAEEHDLIEALSKRYTNDSNADLKKLAADYSHAMGEVSKKYPADDNVATLYAESIMDLRPWKFWTHDGKPAEGTEEIVAVLESVLRRNPRHIGANHYYIHAVESSPHPERALPSARRLSSLSPAAGHLVHMPAHIYQRTGNYAGAANANVEAANADRAYIKRYGGEGFYASMYYNHNLQFGSASFAMTGHFAEAKAMADEMASNVAPMVKDMQMLESIDAAPVLVLVRFGRWLDVVRAKPAEAGPLSTTMSHFARGVAFAQLGDVTGAESERKAFVVARATLTDDPGVMQNSPKAIGEVAAYVLDGRIAMASGDRAAAIAAFTKGVAAADALNYDEPDDWFYPVRESLGAALYRDGGYAEAEKVFREDLARNKKNPRSLFGLAAALRKQKKDATEPSAALRKTWKGAPIKIEDL